MTVPTAAFAYATPVSDALGWVVERMASRDGAEVLDDALWSRIGAEHDAVLTRDATGTALLGAGLAMTTRDLARFGAMLAAGGTNGSTEVVDPAVVETIRAGGDPEVFQRGGHYSYLTGYSYRDQWWLPGGPSRPLSAWGIYGQVLWVEPRRRGRHRLPLRRAAPERGARPRPGRAVPGAGRSLRVVGLTRPTRTKLPLRGGGAGRARRGGGRHETSPNRRAAAHPMTAAMITMGQPRTGRRGS